MVDRNTHHEPWSPDKDHLPGEPGERGSSAFTGSNNFAAPGTGPNQGATRAIGGEYGDVPTRYSDPARPGREALLFAPRSNQAYEDERATARTTGEAVAPDA